MQVIINTIPHKEQRIETVGDYWFEYEGEKVSTMKFLKLEKKHKNPVIQISVSDLGDWRYCMLIAIHELNEVLICLHRGIKEEDITKFDKKFEKERKEGNNDEPGDDLKAPYRKEHFFATTAERALSEKLDVDWAAYDKSIWSLPDFNE